MSLFQSTPADKPSSPGSLLQYLAETRSQITFNSLILAKYLAPALDALPADQKANLLHILQQAEHASHTNIPLHFDRLDLGQESSDEDEPHLESVNLEQSRRKISALQSTNASNHLIADHITTWLPTLWRIGAERGLETKSVHAALTFCADIQCDATVALEITDSRKRLVYAGNASVRTHIAWVWRELFVKRLSVGGVDTIVNFYCQLSDDEVDDILAWIPPTDKDECYLDHWSKGIREVVVGKLRGLLEHLRADGNGNKL